MPHHISKALEHLLFIDLTNQSEVLQFKRELVAEGSELFTYHSVNHNEHCDCREYQRTLALFNVILNYLNQLLRNNSF